MPKSNYVHQPAENTRCPKCLMRMTLLCTADGDLEEPWFYICWICREIAHLGRGAVGEARD